MNLIRTFLFAAIFVSTQALHAQLQPTRLQVDMVWDDPYQPTELRYHLETDFALGANAVIDPVKDNVFLGRIFPNDPSILFFIPAGAFSATDGGYEVLDPLGSGVTIQRVTPPGPNNEPPKLVDDFTGKWSDLNIRLRSLDGGQWRFTIAAEFPEGPGIRTLTRVPSLVQVNVGDDAGAMNPCQINFKSPRDPASGAVKSEVILEETALTYHLSASWNDTGAPLDPLKDLVRVVVEIPGTPCGVITIPPGAFSVANKAFVVKDPNLAGVTIQLVDPGDPNNNIPPQLVDDLTGLWSDLQIRMRSSDAATWHLNINAEIPENPCALPLFNAADQVNVSAGDDTVNLRISNIEYSD